MAWSLCLVQWERGEGGASTRLSIRSISPQRISDDGQGLGFCFFFVCAFQILYSKKQKNILGGVLLRVAVVASLAHHDPIEQTAARTPTPLPRTPARAMGLL